MDALDREILADVRCALSERQYVMWRLSETKKWKPARIAARLGTTRQNVEYHLGQVRRKLVGVKNRNLWRYTSPAARRATAMVAAAPMN